MKSTNFNQISESTDSDQSLDKVFEKKSIILSSICKSIALSSKSKLFEISIEWVTEDTRYTNFYQQLFFKLANVKDWEDMAILFHNISNDNLKFFYGGKQKATSLTDDYIFRNAISDFIESIKPIVNRNIDNYSWDIQSLSVDSLILSNDRFKQLISAMVERKKNLKDKFDYLSQQYKSIKLSLALQRTRFVSLSNARGIILVEREKSLEKVVEDFIWELTPMIYFETSNQVNLLHASLKNLDYFKSERYDLLIAHRSTIKRNEKSKPINDVPELNSSSSASSVIRRLYSSIKRYGPENKNIRYWILFLFLGTTGFSASNINESLKK